MNNILFTDDNHELPYDYIVDAKKSHHCMECYSKLNLKGLLIFSTDHKFNNGF